MALDTEQQKVARRIVRDHAHLDPKTRIVARHAHNDKRHVGHADYFAGICVSCAAIEHGLLVKNA